MKNLLKEISALCVKMGGADFTDTHKQSGWLGNSPATPEDVIKAELRLGIELPDDYKEFLLLTNGFFTPDDALEPTFETVENIVHLKDVDPFLLELWNEGVLIDVGRQLNIAVVVGGLNDEHYFLLIPPNGAYATWQYWKFANWIPGEQRYESLESYFVSVLEFMKSQCR